ncbi:MAG: amidohydrolase family protein [Caulobacteraceae bacterium]
MPLPAGDPDLLVLGGRIVTQDGQRRVLDDSGVAIRGGEITAIASTADLKAKWPRAPVLDADGGVVTPGLINAHQHLTGDPLVRSLIPDAITSDQAIFEWAVPLHSAMTADDDELAATLTAVESLRYGTTTLIEAGTVAHPDRVATGMLKAGVRGGVGCWGWDTPGLPFSATSAEVLARQEEVVRAYPQGGLVEGWVTLVGHDLVSDDLLVGAADLARRQGCGLTFHMSPTEADVTGYLSRRGLRPIAHLQDLGVLGQHLLLAHCVWIEEAEAELLLETRTAVAYCPWTYLRLAQGITRAGRHSSLIQRGGRVALGCDSVNAGDLPDIHRVAALAVGLARDMDMQTSGMTAAAGLDLATIRGAEAIGMGARVGSIEVGKRADLVIHDATLAAWRPAGRADLNLVWGTDGRSVRDVVVDGRIVVRDGRSTLVDEAELAAHAREAQAALLRRAGL